jgi:TM2 domain-containing membrane protein YozV
VEHDLDQPQAHPQGPQPAPQAYRPPAPQAYPPPMGQGWPAPMAPPPQAFAPQVARRSPGVAAFLSFIWMGTGHLYAGAIGLGIVLMLVDAVLLLLALSIIGAPIAFVLWAPLTIFAIAHSASCASRTSV